MPYITNKNIFNNGRLGNQLFSFAVLHSLSIDSGNKLKVVLPMNNGREHNYLQYFTIETPYISLKKIPLKIFKEKESYKYDKNIMLLDKKYSWNLNGYFVSYKYFLHNFSLIRNRLNFVDTIENKTMIEINKIRFQYKNKHIIGVHIRRGELIKTKIVNGKTIKYPCLIYNVPDKYYIKKAMKQFNEKKVVYLVFTGGRRDNDNLDDIRWCKKHLTAENVIFSTNRDAIHDFALLSKCDHFIISCGSFGWWAAMLSKTNPNKKIISLNKELKNKPIEFDWSDYYQKNWIQLSNESE